VLLESAMKRLEDAAVLDRPASMLAAAVSAATSPRLVKNALSGSWLGHRLHPALVPAPMGFWAGATVFDGIGTAPARFAADGLYLPTDPGLTEADQDWVIGKVREFYRGTGPRDAHAYDRSHV
jgi:hypothetical protein